MKFLLRTRYALFVGASVLLSCLFYCPDDSVRAKSLENSYSAEPTVREAQTPDGRAEEDRETPRQVLVKFKKGTDRRTVKNVEAELGLRSVKRLAGSDIMVMEVTSDYTVAETVERLKGIGSVEHAEPNYSRSIR